MKCCVQEYFLCSLQYAGFNSWPVHPIFDRVTDQIQIFEEINEHSQMMENPC